MKSSFNQTTPTDVLAMYVGKTAGVALYDKTTKIWPVNQSRISRVVVESVNGTLNGAYMKHALEAITSGATSTKYMLLTAAGYKYHLNKTYNSSTVATWADGTISFPKGTGPLVTELLVGQTISLQMIMPQRDDVSYSASEDVWMTQYSVPWLPGTTINYSFTKTTTASVELTVKGGLFSGRVHINARVAVKGSTTLALTAKTGTYVTAANDEYASGDTMYYVTLPAKGVNGVALSAVKPTYPAFNKTISLKVTNIQTES